MSCRMCQRSISLTVSKSNSKQGYNMSCRVCKRSVSLTVSKAILFATLLEFGVMYK